eukprot:GILJ01015076.1.p1 GENE.GILJ01015076.1~~GILJ01015076.1.p1  ORF type:complete len:138 (-),score=9.88 GILJ01015076.1:73-486(-)
MGKSICSDSTSTTHHASRNTIPNVNGTSCSRTRSSCPGTSTSRISATRRSTRAAAPKLTPVVAAPAAPTVPMAGLTDAQKYMALLQTLARTWSTPEKLAQITKEVEDTSNTGNAREVGMSKSLVAAFVNAYDLKDLG